MSNRGEGDRSPGDMVLYTYHMDQEDVYGDIFRPEAEHKSRLTMR